MTHRIVRIASAAMDLLAPPRCLACSDEESRRFGLGERCLRLLPGPAAAPCPRCAAPLGPGVAEASCPACREMRPRFASAVAAGPYAGFLGELVRRAKYGRDPLLAVPLRGLLLGAVSRSLGPSSIDAVVSVPTTRRRRRERGFDLAELLSAPVARALDAAFLPCWLERLGEPPPQAALARTHRRHSVRGTVARAHSVLGGPVLGRRGALPGGRVLLVDDVLTTGATADACARVLLACGAVEVRVAVVARA